MKKENPLIRCGCGCGQLRPQFDKYGREGSHIKGHTRIGLFLSDEHKKKISEANKGKKSWNKGKKCPQLSGENSGMYGKSPSEETRKKISETQKGKRTGEENHFYGKKHTVETRKKMSAAKEGNVPWNKGKKTGPLSDEHRKKISERFKGERSYLWKGGITPEHQLIRMSLEYRQWRKEIFNLDNYICKCCGQNGGYLHAHHMNSFSEYPEQRFDIRNGITLCKQCHINIHVFLKNEERREKE